MKAPFTAETPPKTIPSADVEIHKQPSTTLIAIKICDALSDTLKKILQEDTLGSPEKKHDLIIGIKNNIRTLTTWLQNPMNSDIECADELAALASLANANLARNDFESSPAAIDALASIRTKIHAKVFSSHKQPPSSA